MYQLYFSFAFVLIIFSLPIYIQYTELKLEQAKNNNTCIWSLFFSTPRLGLILTIIALPLIGIMCIYEVVKYLFVNRSIKAPLLLSALMPACWLVMLFLGYIQHSS
jgi:hypothetical protein